ncbi:MAG: hypothetical protein N2442_05590 [Spirochaetes bacterium]|nr:hypothetical protein [Spirochaetota bacterium]
MVFPKELQPLLYTSDPERIVTILDALESVTNGMENPGLLEQIKQISIDSPLRPYVDLIFALQAYYRKDPNTVDRFLKSIPDSTPPARLKPLLSFLSGLSKNPPEGIVEKEIVKAILNRKSHLETALEEAELFLQQNHEESFSDSIAYLIRELYGKFPESSKQLTLWALEKAREKGWEGILLDGHLKMIFGDLEAHRLKAVSLFLSGHRGAFQAWSSFLMKLLLAGTTNVQVVEASLLIWAYAGIQEQRDPQLLNGILDVLEKKYPSVKETYRKVLEDVIYSRGVHNHCSTPHPVSTPTTHANSSRKKSSIVQLELFPT